METKDVVGGRNDHNIRYVLNEEFLSKSVPFVNFNVIRNEKFRINNTEIVPCRMARKSEKYSDEE